ncbi:MAG: hypothetical protein ACLR0V_11620 [Roseburia hominis]
MEYEQIIKHWKDKKIATVVDLRESLSSYSIIFAYNSGAIENPEITYHNTREVFENGKVVNFTGNLRTVYEIANQKACFGAMLQHIVDRDPVTSELICEIHKYLTQGTYDERRWERGERPGTFKIHDYCVADGQGGTTGGCSDGNTGAVRRDGGRPGSWREYMESCSISALQI